MGRPLPVGQRVVITEFGETPDEALEHFLSIEAQAPPEPSALGEGDVLIAVRSAAVNWVDLLMTSGQYQHMPAPPYCPGLEYSGEVVWKGAAVDNVELGDAVIADGLQTGPRSLGDYQSWGGFASYAVAPSAAVIPLPEGLSFDQGACLLGSYETAYHCLIRRAALREGETVLIHGASGVTGLAAVHVAKLLGATVIATGRSAGKLDTVRGEGADHVLCTATAEDGGGLRSFREEVKALTSGRGVDVVYDGVGGDISLESLRCVRFGARYLVVGWAATPFVARGKGGRGAPSANVLPTNLIMMKGLDVLGCPAAISAHHDPSIREERIARILTWVAEGRISPVVAKAYPLSEIREAMAAKWASRFVGACVVHPGE